MVSADGTALRWMLHVAFLLRSRFGGLYVKVMWCQVLGLRTVRELVKGVGGVVEVVTVNLP